MKIIYVGGYSENNKDKSHFYEYAHQVKKYIESGKNVVFVTFANPAGYFNPRLIELYGKLPNVIDTEHEKNINWESYDLIYIPGGNTENLKNSLLGYGFDFKKLKKDVIIICDSAGANLMSRYYIGKRKKSDSSMEYFLENGLNKKSNLLTVCHIDSLEKAPLEKIEKAKSEANSIGATLLLLKENTAKIVEDDLIKDFLITEVLSEKN